MPRMNDEQFYTSMALTAIMKEEGKTVNKMNAADALQFFQNYPRDHSHFPPFYAAMDAAIDALQSSIPHVITLEEARKLEPHTPVWVEYRNYSRGNEILMGDSTYIKQCYAVGDRIWIGGWPSPELRAATPW